MREECRTGSLPRSPMPTTVDDVPKGLKLPYYDDSKDDTDSYIGRFERYAEACKWDRSRYAAYLGNQLQGKALKAYVRMPLKDISDYEKLKNTLLRRFEMTEEGFRRKFHSSRMEKGETASQFMSKLTDCFDRWTKLTNIQVICRPA